MRGKTEKKEFGDYQTPPDFAEMVCKYLYDDLNIRPKFIIEPTAGVGAFLKASLNIFKESEKVFGVEIYEKYCDKCREILDDRLTIICDDFFNFNTPSIVDTDSKVLIVGNPPWVTNSDLEYNLPKKMNFKKLSGTDAITGASNFDICEYMILKLIEEFKNTDATIAMLCKTSVARNVFQEIYRRNINSGYFKIINFNATKIFNISASACLLVIDLKREYCNLPICEVSDIEDPTMITSIIKCSDGVLTNISENVLDLEGNCCFEWRQGVKHDCSGIMELKKIGSNIYENKRKEKVKLEETLVFPLMKSSSFKKPIISDNFSKFVIVTQKKTRDDTKYIRKLAPLTWKYLNDNIKLFDKRKSSIYRGAPPFSMFGVGDYSYSKYKVGVSGFYKKPLFSLLFNCEDIAKPIMLDDTSYFISFENYDDAYTCMLMLNSDKVQDFLYSISFQDAKRPYTKKVLQRLDIEKCIKKIKLKDLMETELKYQLPKYITDNIFDNFKNRLFEEYKIDFGVQLSF